MSVQIRIHKETLDKIHEFSLAISSFKAKAYAKDGRKIVTRWETGRMGECAVEQLLKQDFVDWEIGNCSDFNVPDLSVLGLNIGIKTARSGNSVLIHKKPKRPEIICMRLNDNTVDIMGLASVGVLECFQDDDLIKDSNVRAKGSKTGFAGYTELRPFRTVDDLSNLLYNVNSL